MQGKGPSWDPSPFLALHRVRGVHEVPCQTPFAARLLKLVGSDVSNSGYSARIHADLQAGSVEHNGLGYLSL